MHINREWKDGRYTTGKRVAHTRPLEIKTNLYEENPTQFWPKPNAPLVSREMFDAVQNLLRQHHTEFMQKKSIANDYLGTGLLHCACGLKMYHQCGSASKQYEYYRCVHTYQKNYKGTCTQANIATGLIDEKIVHDAMEFFKNKKFIATKIREGTDVAENGRVSPLCGPGKRNHRTTGSSAQAASEAIRHGRRKRPRGHPRNAGRYCRCQGPATESGVQTLRNSQRNRR